MAMRTNWKQMAQSWVGKWRRKRFKSIEDKSNVVTKFTCDIQLSFWYKFLQQWKQFRVNGGTTKNSDFRALDTGRKIINLIQVFHSFRSFHKASNSIRFKRFWYSTKKFSFHNDDRRKDPFVVSFQIRWEKRKSLLIDLFQLYFLFFFEARMSFF